MPCLGLYSSARGSLLGSRRAVPCKKSGMDACAVLWGLMPTFLARWNGSRRLSVQVLVGSCVMLAMIFGCPVETGIAGVAGPVGPT